MLGNFVNRVTKFCVARFDGQVPGEGEYGEDEHALIAEMDRRIAQYTEFMEDAEFRKALGELRAIWVAGNEYMTRAAPWTHIKTDRAKAAVGVRMGLNLVHQFAHLIWPVMPSFARTIHECIQPVGYRGGVIPFPNQSMEVLLNDLEPGQTIKAPEVLVAKITDEQVAELKAEIRWHSITLSFPATVTVSTTRVPLSSALDAPRRG